MSEEERALAALEQRWWRRAERRAVAGSERWAGQVVRELASAGTPVLAVAGADADRPAWPARATRSGGLAGETEPSLTAGVLALTLPGWELLLAGVAEGPRSALDGQGLLRLAAAGRYGRFWWLQIVSAPVGGAEQRITVLSTHLRLVPGSGGGPRRSPDPAGAAPVARTSGRAAAWR